MSRMFRFPAGLCLSEVLVRFPIHIHSGLENFKECRFEIFDPSFCVGLVDELGTLNFYAPVSETTVRKHFFETVSKSGFRPESIQQVFPTTVKTQKFNVAPPSWSS